MKSMNLDGLQRFLSAYLRIHWGHPLECTGDMLYKTDRRHGLHHGGEQLAFPALA
jgi:hypothetical protein